MANTITLWDLPIRIFHWLLVLAIVSSYATGQLSGSWLDWHTRSGLFIFALIVFRIAWGFIGSTHARFANFIPTLRSIKQYYSSRWTKPGHSPPGAISVFVMLTLILAQVSTGLFTVEEDLEVYGPLCHSENIDRCQTMSHWHITLVDWLIVIITLHISAIFYHLLIKRNNLILPMITGNSVVSNQNCVEKTLPASKGSLVLGITISIILVWLVTSSSNN